MGEGGLPKAGRVRADVGSDLPRTRSACDNRRMAAGRKIYPSTSRSRRLRRNETDAERAIWRLLRNRQFAKSKFRRQHPIGPYVVDFYCHDRRLVIEIDGGQHTAERDRKRSQFLEKRGLTVLRFWNNEVLGNIDGVGELILRALDGD